MTPSEYRKQIESEMASEARTESVTDVGATPSLVDDVAILADTDAPEDVRLAALTRLRLASFGHDEFPRVRPEYFEALRDVVRDEASSEALLVAALGVLISESDSVAQDFLKTSLTSPDTAKIDTATALRLLGSDDHANTGTIARKIFDESDDPAIRSEAIRALATDPTAKALLSSVFMDKSEATVTRNAAGNGLRLLDPNAFGTEAAKVIADTAEDDDLRTESLAALSNISGALENRVQMELRSVTAQIGAAPGAMQKGVDRLTARLSEDGKGGAEILESVAGQSELILTKSF